MKHWIIRERHNFISSEVTWYLNLPFSFSPIWMLHAKLNFIERTTPRLNNKIWQLLENVFLNKTQRNQYNFVVAQLLVLHYTYNHFSLMWILSMMLVTFGINKQTDRIQPTKKTLGLDVLKRQILSVIEPNWWLSHHKIVVFFGSIIILDLKHHP